MEAIAAQLTRSRSSITRHKAAYEDLSRLLTEPRISPKKNTLGNANIYLYSRKSTEVQYLPEQVAPRPGPYNPTPT